MITASELAPYRTTSEDYVRTQELKARFRRIREKRHPLYLDRTDFDEILEWKLASQYGRVRWRLEINSDEVVRTVTQAALTVSHPDPDYELALRVGLLTTMSGVGVPVASAILALVFPEQYCVIDFRVWRQAFGQPAYGFTVRDYGRYMEKIRPLAAELGWQIQEVDLALWDYDRRNNG